MRKLIAIPSISRKKNTIQDSFDNIIQPLLCMLKVKNKK